MTAASPDGALVLTVATDNDQRPTWSLSRKGKLLLAPSKLGFLLTDGIALQRGFAHRDRRLFGRRGDLARLGDHALCRLVGRRRLRGELAPHAVERHAFYAEARAAFAIVRSGERRFYGNILLTKGVVDAAGKAPKLPGLR